MSKERKKDEKRMMKSIVIPIMIMMLFLLTTKNVLAIGVAPGKTVLDFEAGLTKEITLTVINNEKKDMNALISVRGELAQYVTLNKVLVPFTSAEESKTITINLNLPSAFEKPGQHQAEIVIMELPAKLEGEGTFIGATLSVVSKIIVRVPYPGKYAETQLNVQAEKDKVTFFIPVYNYGSLDVVAKSDIEIYGPTNELIGKIESDEKIVQMQDKKELVAEWKEKVNPGSYFAASSTVYNGKAAKSETAFAVGNFLIEILDVKVNNFVLGGIAKFEISVENKWNQNADVYAEMIISDKGAEIARIKSPTSAIKAESRDTLIAYWDTININRGDYDAKIVLHYASGQNEKNMVISVKEGSISTSFLTAGKVVARPKGSNIVTILVTLVIILIVINILWFIYIKRRKK